MTDHPYDTYAAMVKFLDTALTDCEHNLVVLRMQPSWVQGDTTIKNLLLQPLDNHGSVNGKSLEHSIVLLFVEGSSEEYSSLCTAILGEEKAELLGRLNNGFSMALDGWGACDIANA